MSLGSEQGKPDAQALSGQMIAHYRVARHLGSGGMGEVFLAEDTKLDRSVALKLLPKEVASDASRRKRFLAEAKAASALNHSSVCTIYEVGETTEGQPFIAMEYLEGQTLDALSRRRRLELREIVGIGVQVAEALEAARQNQVVHRDIKPGNIMMDAQGRVKVLDFGLAKRLDQPGDAPTLTQEGAIVGTPNYLNPELALGREVDSRSDIFSLGVVLYELAAGRNPFAGASFGETVNNILNKSPEPLKPWNPTVTAEFERIVFKCLEKDVAKRYATPRELAADLRRLEVTQDGRDARNGKVLWMLATAGVTVCLLALIAWQFLRPVPDHGKTPGAAQTSGTPTTLSRQRLVLLPFKSLASGEANEIFTEGLAVELGSKLSHIRGLHVIDGSGFVKAQGEGKDFSARWRELNAGALLKGTVLKEEKQLRIRLQLLDSQSQELLKAFDFDGKLESVLALQTEAAEAIASALEVQLLAEERRQLALRPTENSQAYQIYVEGRAFWNRRTGEDITNAIARFNQAIAEDPAYALAHAGLADCYVILPEYASRPSGDAFPKAKAAALDALKYDSTLAEPHATLAYVKAYFDWDWSGAEAEFRRAIALNPRYATAHHWLAVVLQTSGRFAEGLAEMELARALDPLSPIINATYGNYLFFGGKPDSAVEFLKKQIALDPSFVGAHNSLGLVYAYQGKWPETIAEFETIRRLDQNGAFGLDLLGMAYARVGRTNEAQKVLSHLLELQRQGLELRIHIATVLHGLGDDEGALKSLEEGLADHALGLDWMNSEPYLKDLRAHRRAQAILRKMNLVTGGPDPNSVAVLPFVNMSADKADEYLSDSITDELISTLQQISGLQVKGRASSFYFKGKNENPQRIGQDLQVKYLVEGTVSKAGNKLRIKADLITATDGVQLWGTAYNRDFSDFFKVQSEVAGAIAAEVQVRLTPEDRGRLARAQPVNREALEAYLLGMRHLWQWSEEGYTRALRYFQKAIQIDPNYAPAHAGAALAYEFLAFWSGPPKEMLKCKQAAQRAIELDPFSVDAYLARGWARMSFDWDWPGAESDFRRGLELSPNSSLALDGYNNYLVPQGRLEEAVAMLNKALELDPLSPGLHSDMGASYYFADQPDRAIPHFLKALEFDPKFLQAHFYLGWCYLFTGKPDEAMTEFKATLQLAPDWPWAQAAVGYAYGVTGHRPEAMQVLADLDELGRKRYVTRFSQAFVHLGLGQKDVALDWLEKACKEQDGYMTFLKTDPVFAPLRSEPRYRSLLRKVNLASALATNAPTAGPPKSVAVLPFVNMSSDKENEYLSDGLTEEVLNSLARVKGLRVPARTSCFVFKGKIDDIRKIGEQLSVATVLEGSVRKAGSQLRITAQLINVADGFHLWSETYDRDMTNIFALQSDIAMRVAEALQGQILGEERQQLAKRGTENAEAYRLYLLGRHHWAKLSDEGFTNAVTCFQRAIQKDSKYARAYAGLADTYCWMATWELAPKTVLPLAREAALQALALDPSLAEARYVLGWVKVNLEWDFSGAEEEFKRAIELHPNLALAHDAYASFLSTQRRFSEAVREQQRAIELDPLSGFLNMDLAWCFWHKRDFDRVIDQALRTLELDSNYAEAHRVLAWGHLWKGQTNAAIASLEKARSLNGIPWIIGQLGYPYAVTGQRAKALAILEELKAMEGRRYVCPSAYLPTHVGLGDKGNAFVWLRKCLDERDIICPYLNVDPFFDSLRSDPRFTALLKEVGLVK